MGIVLLGIFVFSFLVSLVHHLRQSGQANPYFEMTVIVGFLPQSSRLAVWPLTDLMLWWVGLLGMVWCWRRVLQRCWRVATA